MSDWQPIETAPMEWEPIIVWAISESEWDDAEDDEREPNYSAMVAMHSALQPGYWWLCASGMTRVRRPMAWMPVPSAPALTEQPA